MLTSQWRLPGRRAHRPLVGVWQSVTAYSPLDGGCLGGTLLAHEGLDVVFERVLPEVHSHGLALAAQGRWVWQLEHGGQTLSRSAVRADKPRAGSL